MYLAIAGEWRQAQQVAEFYETYEYKKYLGDVRYLLARSQEYQMHFLDLKSVTLYSSF